MSKLSSAMDRAERIDAAISKENASADAQLQRLREVHRSSISNWQQKITTVRAEHSVRKDEIEQEFTTTKRDLTARREQLLEMLQDIENEMASAALAKEVDEHANNEQMTSEVKKYERMIEASEAALAALSTPTNED